MEKDYRETLYKDYADSFKNNTAKFNHVTADKWGPCLKYYLRNWLPAGKGAHIIDLGCGDGRILYLLQRMGYTNIEGVDISESQLKIARQVSERVANSDVIKYLKDTSDKYDLIISIDVIEHLQKSEALDFLDLCGAHLNNNGRLILQTPNASSPFFGDVRYGDFTHELSFTPKLLSQLLARACFTNIESREAGPVPSGYSLKSSIRYVIWRILRVLFCFMEIIETGSCDQRIYTRVFLISAKVGKFT